jgi:hypothetical protein
VKEFSQIVGIIGSCLLALSALHSPTKREREREQCMLLMVAIQESGEGTMGRGSN